MEPEYWPPNSPDLNILDYFVWGIFESKIWEETITNIDDLKLAILREWEAFPYDTINRAIDSFRRRIQMVIDEEEGHIERYL